MSPDDERHGTYTGYRKHHKDGEPACGPCRQANADYTRNYRSDPLGRRRANEFSKAQSRARVRLADLHWDEYQRLYAEELTAIRSAREAS